MIKKHSFQNFAVDHLTLCLHPKLYTVLYAVFRVLFGLTPEDILYEKRRQTKNGKELSMTYATRLGSYHPAEKNPLNTILAVVQPTESSDEPSHVREMLDGHELASHLQHIALRTNDLIKFHQFALERGIQFVTPILKDDHENLIQLFSGELFYPGSKPSGLFFEFLQREPSSAAVAELQKLNKQTWFRDETFLGLYQEKELEYRSGKVRPFICEKLFNAISEHIGNRQVWDLTDQELVAIENLMIEVTKKG